MQEQTSRADRVVIITSAGGLRIDATLRGHTVRTDQPPQAGGTDTAVTPLELLPASLGACIALYAQQFCNARDLPTEGLCVEVGYETEKTPKRIARLDVKLVLPEDFPDQQRAAIERAVRTCPVHNTLTHPPHIDLEITAAAAASA